jgi:hypothetical protein
MNRVRAIKIFASGGLLCGLLIVYLAQKGLAEVRREPTYVTITRLPLFPELPNSAFLISQEEKKKIVYGVIDHKLSTYPKGRLPLKRIGKFTGTGLYPDFDLRDDQLKTLAVHYDHNSLPFQQKHLALILKKHNPSFKVCMYIDSGIHPEKNLEHIGIDVGNVDDENIDWILKKHPDWLLRDKKGDPIRSAPGTLSFPGEYWPDPGNKGFQDFFAAKINIAIKESGGVWDGLLIDQFFGRIENYTGYAGTNPQARYRTDQEFQAAQLAFLKRVAELIKLPIIANLDGSAAAVYPEFFVQIAKTAGGVENEVFPFESSDVADHSFLPEETLKELIDAILKIPKDKHVRLNSKPGGMVGDIDRTLYAYYCYLLIASPDREIYWTFKEGDSGVPHYWFDEFNLDIGTPKEEMKTIGNFQKDSMGRNVVIGDLWKRDYTRATVLVNPRRDHEATYNFDGKYYDVLGQALANPISIKPRSAMLIIKDLNVLKR